MKTKENNIISEYQLYCHRNPKRITKFYNFWKISDKGIRKHEKKHLKEMTDKLTEIQEKSMVK